MNNCSRDKKYIYLIVKKLFYRGYYYDNIKAKMKNVDNMKFQELYLIYFLKYLTRITDKKDLKK